MPMKNILVIYHHFPHYREPILRYLTSSDLYKYTLYGDHSDFQGIKVYKGDGNQLVVNELRFSYFKGIWFLSGYLKPVVFGRYDLILMHGHISMPAAWIALVVSKIRRKKLVFWAHGWLKVDSFLKNFLKKLLYGFSDAVMTYGWRAPDLARKSGYLSSNIYPIGNSLDWCASKLLLNDFNKKLFDDLVLCRFERKHDRIIVCSARLTQLCRFDLLLDAVSILKAEGSDLGVVLIGDGPDKDNLIKHAQRDCLDVVFFGACYDYDTVGLITYFSDLTVSPGKVGLTAIQSMMFGTPVITHNDFDRQMPEFEAIVPGHTGDFFDYGSSSDLASKIKCWFSSHVDRDEIRVNCFSEVEAKWNPVSQGARMESVFSELLL